MTLAFPNPSRSFDEARNAVRFFGYDGMFEIQFFVEAGVLAKAGATSSGSPAPEAECLSAFDALRASIYDVAREAYSHDHLNSYTLTVSDFRSAV
ncbi:DUF1488 domain-containing protein [Labrys sp. ZIDIC5]|uniref:DUF1488 domain-containing protein n=1 Tax=Labrys sedimenti TaxID=3106036 RepID=UPI002ACA8CF2|nr:DUF1488 domain-containing protein [Labrys sp. ZIDIC5]MDZ5454557.1 DUF1488 domain-containing protein [Labrys sp. ZIDIC5]